jgi:hypothetical protein
MSVFANLIPGIREARVPLAAGGITLLALALAVEPSLPDEKSASGLMASIIAVHEALGPVGQGGVIAFAAYLVGSIVQGISTAVARRFPLGRMPVGPAGPKVETYSPLHLFAIEKSRIAFDRIEEAYEKDLYDLAKDDALTGLAFFEVFQSYVQVDGLEGETPFERVSRLLAAQIASESELTQRRLLGAEPEWFAEVDRFEAEAELREAIALPLLALGIVCAVRIPDARVAAAIFLGTLAFTLMLLAQGNRRRKRANETLAEAVIVDRVKATALERFESDVNTLVDRTARPMGFPRPK